MEGKTDERTNHPHYAKLVLVWRDMKRRHSGVVPDWMNFWNFFEWAISNKWEPGATIRNYYKGKPKGPENCFIDFKGDGKLDLDEIDIKGGSKNCPCNTCNIEEAGSCTRYKTCLTYRAWIHHSWKGFREAALVKYGKTTIG